MVCKIAHAITGIAAVNTGLCAVLGMDLIASYLGAVKVPVDLVIGAAGVVSIAMMVMCCLGGGRQGCKS